MIVIPKSLTYQIIQMTHNGQRAAIILTAAVMIVTDKAFKLENFRKDYLLE